MIDWKEVKKENYVAFSNEIFFSQYSKAKALLEGSGGMLIVWDVPFELNNHTHYYGRSVQHSLNLRSDIMKDWLQWDAK